jgi:tetratricopeptide (TPR) repeat protein
MSIVLVFLAFQPAGTAPPTPTQQIFEQARCEYNLGNFSRAITGFENAYRASGGTAQVILYNIGQAKRQAGDVRGAVEAYKAYLREKPDASNRAAVETRIRELESAKPGATFESSLVSDIVDPFEYGVYAQPPKLAKPAPLSEVNLIATPVPQPTVRSTRHAAPLIVAGATVVLVAAAVVSGLLADARYRELHASCGGTAIGCARGDIDGLKSRALVTNVLWRLAAGSAVTTGVLFYVDRGSVGFGGRF